MNLGLFKEDSWNNEEKIRTSLSTTILGLEEA